MEIGSNNAQVGEVSVQCFSFSKSKRKSPLKSEIWVG